MAVSPVTLDTVQGFLRDLAVRVTRLERHTHPTGGGPVFIGEADPDVAHPHNRYALWVVTGNGPLVLRAKVDGVWSDVDGSGSNGG